MVGLVADQSRANFTVTFGLCNDIEILSAGISHANISSLKKHTADWLQTARI